MIHIDLDPEFKITTKIDNRPCQPTYSQNFIKIESLETDRHAERKQTIT